MSDHIPESSRREAMDAHRARALHGDPLEDLTVQQREFVWRSLLKGIRWKTAVQLAGLSPEEAQAGIEVVLAHYSRYLLDRHARRTTPRRAPSAGMPAADRRSEAPLE